MWGLAAAGLTVCHTVDTSSGIRAEALHVVRGASKVRVLEGACEPVTF